MSQAHAEEHAGGEAAATAEASSERQFRDRLVSALKRGSIKDLVAIWKDDYLEPHMHLFVLLAMSIFVGAILWIVEPLLI